MEGVIHLAHHETNTFWFDEVLVFRTTINMVLLDLHLI